MLRIYGVFLGFALFGAVFAAVYYEPENRLRTSDHPTYRFGPGGTIVDFVEPRGPGQNVTVNITILSGGPVAVHVMDVVNLEPLVDANNSTLTLRGPINYTDALSDLYVEKGHDFLISSDGQIRWAVLVTSLAEINESLPLEEQTTDVKIQVRYLERERKDLVMGYVMAAPSVALIGYTLYRYRRRRNGEQAAAASVPGDGFAKLL